MHSRPPILVLIAFWYLIIGSIFTVVLSPFNGLIQWKWTTGLITPIGTIICCIFWRQGDKWCRLSLFALCLFRALLPLYAVGLLALMLSAFSAESSALQKLMTPLYITLIIDSFMLLSISAIVVAYRNPVANRVLTSH